MKRISYIIAAKNAAAFLKKCVDSLKDQEMPAGWDYEILIGVDACPETLEHAKLLADGTKIRVFEMLEHSGPYVTANTLVANSTGEWIFRIDADDTCDQGRTKRMLTMAHRKSARMANSYYREVNTAGEEVKTYKKAAEGNWAYRKDLWEEVGGWDAWPCSADSMFLVRARRLERGNEVVVQKTLYTRLLHPGQLTTDPVLGKRTAERERHRKMIIAEKQRVDSGRLPTKPVRACADFIEHDGQSLGEPQTRPRVTASLASIPDREKALRKTVNSLLPQVDKLNVYLNGYSQVPHWLQDERIEVARSQQHGDRGDAGKFFWADDIEGVHFTCDDDIVYPRDYVRKTLLGLEKYHWRCAVSHHGRVLPPNTMQYYKGHTRFWHCGQQSEGGFANVLGTGVLAYHTDYVKVSREDFKEANMADLWFGLLCQQQKAACVCLPHEAAWLKIQPIVKTIYSASQAKDGSSMDTRARQDELAREHGRSKGWKVHEPRDTKIVVAVTTFNRPNNALELLRDLEAENKTPGFRLDVRVYNDASTENYGAVQQFCKDRDWKYKRFRKNFGKTEHAKLITEVYSDMKGTSADLFCVLPDDCRLIPGFCGNLLSEWHAITDRKKVSLAVAVLKGRETASCWTTVQTKQHNGGIQVGWVDGFNAFNRDYLEALGYAAPCIRTKAGISSGMGKGISTRLTKLDLHMYRASRSLVVSLDLPSQMHPEARKKTPLPTVLHKHGPPLPKVYEQADVQGIKVNCLPNDHIGKTLLAGGYYEHDMLKAISKLNLEGVYVDVGSFVGTHALWFAKKCPSTKVLAIEPQRHCAALIRKSVEDNGLEDKVEVVYGAVAEGLARVGLGAVEEGNRGMTKVAEGDSVIAYELDALLHHVDNVVLIKIDVEGMEPAALRSAKQVIAKHKPVIVTEAWNEEALAQQAAELPGYTHGKAFCRTPTYIWTFQQQQ